MQDLIPLQARLTTVVQKIRTKHPSFDEALTSYEGQYGEDAVAVHEPFKISSTIDPVIIILGRTTTLFYRDSRRALSGSRGSVSIEPDNVYVLGRRSALDSRLVVWSPQEEIEVEQYDARTRIIPSRIHAAIFGLENGDVLFSDLGSSSGSVIVGETQKPEPFVTLYLTPKANIHRVSLEQKYKG
jgi:pSer/pThr/pTyr-binding forkhead associated (FHA) protein